MFTFSACDSFIEAAFFVWAVYFCFIIALGWNNRVILLGNQGTTRKISLLSKKTGVMGSIKAESDSKTELDDSGCVQDVGTPEKLSLESGSPVELLDLSDDVMLHILKYCSPLDLKALGFTCPRLGSLVLDRTLWVHVEGLTGCGPRRLAWLLAHALGETTKSLAIEGFAREADRCLGILNRNREEETSPDCCEPDVEDKEAGTSSQESLEPSSSRVTPDTVAETPRETYERRYSALERAMLEVNQSIAVSNCAGLRPTAGDPTCPGPQFTLSARLLRNLRAFCPNLIELTLDYVNLNCAKTPLCNLPRGLKRLSLRGLKCYNVPADKCFLFKIQDYFTTLEYLDVSECDWLEPASILGLSKIPRLRHLVMRDCCKMSEFVAYASLACRYGFRMLQVMDLRGSPVGDSEVSALSWAPRLEELYVSVANRAEFPPEHTHFRGDVLAPFTELKDWENDIPEHFSSKQYLYLGDEDQDSKDSPEDSPQPQHNPGTIEDCSRYIIVDPRDIQQAGSSQNGSGDAEPGPSRKNRRHSDSDPSHDDRGKTKTSSKNTNSKNTKRPKNSDSEDDGDVPAKRKRQKGVNEGASTSRSNPGRPEARGDPATLTRKKAKHKSMCVCFDEGFKEQPIVLRHNESEPLHKILYVNVSRRLHTVYKLSRPICTVYNPEDNDSNNIIRRGRNIAQISTYLPSYALSRLDPSSLITDTALRSFGESDNDNVNYIQIGPQGPTAYNRRPARTSLRVLSVTGFRSVTNRTLTHLATAAPSLMRLDLSRTSVTQAGVDTFKSLRPECEVVYSKFEE